MTDGQIEPDCPSDPRFELAYRMSTDQLIRQISSLDELRTRVGVVFSGASVATGFLASAVLGTRGSVPTGAWLGMAASLGLVAVSAYILAPTSWQGFVHDGQAVLDDVTNCPTRPMDEYYRETAEFAAVKVKANGPDLQHRYCAFTGMLGLLAVDLGGWMWALAARR